MADDREVAKIVIYIIDELIPKYMVCKNVVNLVDEALKKIKGGVTIARWKDREAKAAWVKFEQIVFERCAIISTMKMKSRSCSNYANCHVVNTKYNFMRCGGCNTALYCSRQCQKTAWREGGHKFECKFLKQEYIEGQILSTSKTEYAYFQHLCTSDLTRYLQYIKKHAESRFPSLAQSPTSFVIQLDYTIFPPKFSLHPFAEHENHSLYYHRDGSPYKDRHGNRLVDCVGNHPGEYGLVQSQLARGEQTVWLSSVVTRHVLEAGGWFSG